MKIKDEFSNYHPLVNFLYFGLVICFSCFFMHPICLAVSFASAVMYYITLKRKKAVGFLIKFAIPLMVITAIINPAFSHAGITILCYLPSGNPLTLESILYGVSASFMLSSMILWFACFSEIITTDKFVYLFGKITPAFSLMLSMTLRFVPRFKAQFDTVKETQLGLGRDTSNGSIIKRIKNALICFSIVVTWSLENAVDTSDSMKSRGYGTGKRTAYSIYAFTSRDKTAIAFLLFCGFALICGAASGNLFWRYYPSIRGCLFEPITIFSQIIYLCLCIMPVIIDRREEAVWKHSVSKI